MKWSIKQLFFEAMNRNTLAKNVCIFFLSGMIAILKVSRRFFLFCFIYKIGESKVINFHLKESEWTKNTWILETLKEKSHFISRLNLSFTMPSIIYFSPLFVVFMIIVMH